MSRMNKIFNLERVVDETLTTYCIKNVSVYILLCNDEYMAIKGIIKGQEYSLSDGYNC